MYKASLVTPYLITLQLFCIETAAYAHTRVRPRARPREHARTPDRRTPTLAVSYYFASATLLL